jgi:drug/metabolite transporter (DMT)-like permease
MDSNRKWAVFSLAGIVLWVGAMVLAGVLSDDPTDPGPTITTFVVGGAIFFGLMFGAALWQQLRSKPSAAAPWVRPVAIGYTLAGIAVTGLGFAAVWRGADGHDVGIFIYPLVGIVVVWAAVALAILRRIDA